MDYIKKIKNIFRKKIVYTKNTITILESTKCLIIAPHPDDDVIGCGGFLINHKDKCDVVCFSSSGIAYKNITAEDRAELRIAEFKKVMAYLGIKKHLIYKTFGIPYFIDKIKSRFDDYLKDINLLEYDYIFMPNPNDNHEEHLYLTNVLIKQFLKETGYKNNLKIVFYEVWSPLSAPNYFLDISNIITEKQKLIGMYESQLVYINYVAKITALNSYRGMLANNVDFAEAYQVININKYLRR